MMVRGFGTKKETNKVSIEHTMIIAWIGMDWNEVCRFNAGITA